MIHSTHNTPPEPGMKQKDLSAWEDPEQTDAQLHALAIKQES